MLHFYFIKICCWSSAFLHSSTLRILHHKFRVEKITCGRNYCKMEWKCIFSCTLIIVLNKYAYFACNVATCQNYVLASLDCEEKISCCRYIGGNYYWNCNENCIIIQGRLIKIWKYFDFRMIYLLIWIHKNTWVFINIVRCVTICSLVIQGLTCQKI